MGHSALRGGEKGERMWDKGVCQGDPRRGMKWKLRLAAGAAQYIDRSADVCGHIIAV